jgi:hypothetical protein
VRADLASWVAILLCGFGAIVAGQEKPWLTDEQAREVAGAAVRAVYPSPCYNTYRDERLEDFLPSLRRYPIVENHLNNSVYFYHVSSGACDYVVVENGKPALRTQVTTDCCEYGMVAIDRVTSKSFWFRGMSVADTFKDFVRDERLHPDSSEPTLFSALYRELVWGQSNGKEIQSLGQLRELVQSNFQVAYSPGETDTKWQPKFGIWWRKFRSRTPRLKLDTTYESIAGGTIVRGYGFSGFQLTIPESGPPPKGTPKLFQWALLIKSDGTVEEQSPKLIYSSP